MASVSVSHLVIFIASIVVAAGVAGVLVTEVDSVSTSISEQSSAVSNSIETDIQVISDKSSEADAIYDGSSNNVTLLVKNVGSRDLTAQSADIGLLVEGRFISSQNVGVELVENPSGTDWTPGAVVRLEADLGDAFGGGLSGDVRATVVVDDNEDSIRFRA